MRSRRRDGLWRVRLRRQSDGAEIEQLTRNLRHRDRRASAARSARARSSVAGLPLVSSVGDRLLQSDEVLTIGGFERVADLLAGKRNPRVAVIGGSTSAIATIALLLKSKPALPWGPQAITLLHRRAAAPVLSRRSKRRMRRGSPISGRTISARFRGFVYRLAGFRLEARELVLRMLGDRRSHRRSARALAPDRWRRRRGGASASRAMPISSSPRSAIGRARCRCSMRTASRSARRASRRRDGRSPLPDHRRRRHADRRAVRHRPRRGLRAVGRAGRRGELHGPGQRPLAMAERRRADDRRPGARAARRARWHDRARRQRDHGRVQRRGADRARRIASLHRADLRRFRVGRGRRLLDRRHAGGAAQLSATRASA